MKQVLSHKRRLTYKDIFRYIMVVIAHFMLMIIYAALITLISWGIHGVFIRPFDNLYAPMLAYAILIGPIVNTAFHILFTERGLPWLRLMMWIHTIICFIFITLGGLL